MLARFGEEFGDVLGASSSFSAAAQDDSGDEYLCVVAVLECALG